LSGILNNLVPFVVELGVGGMNDGQFLQDAYSLSKSCSSLDVKGSGSTLTSTDVPNIGLQSCPTLQRPPLQRPWVARAASMAVFARYDHE